MPLCLTVQASAQWMSTMCDDLHVNERCVCLWRPSPPGNLLTGPAATIPFRSTVPSGCQLPSMPCSSNYRLWICSTLRLAVRVPCLAAAQIQRRRQPGPLWGDFKEPETSSLVFSSRADTPQTTQSALTAAACFYFVIWTLQQMLRKHRLTRSWNWLSQGRILE